MSMEHPYREFESSPLWPIIEGAIHELAANGDIDEKTPSAYIVGFLCQAIYRQRDRIVSTGVENSANTLAALLPKIRGKYAFVSTNSDDFIKRKAEELRLEER